MGVLLPKQKVQIAPLSVWVYGDEEVCGPEPSGDPSAFWLGVHLLGVGCRQTHILRWWSCLHDLQVSTALQLVWAYVEAQVCQRRVSGYPYAFWVGGQLFLVGCRQMRSWTAGSDCTSVGIGVG